MEYGGRGRKSKVAMTEANLTRIACAHLNHHTALDEVIKGNCTLAPTVKLSDQ